MRIAVIMNQKSPWGRDMVMALAELGAEVHVIDFATPGSETEYMASQDDKQAASIQEFRKRVAGIHLLSSSYTSPLRYITSAPQVARICRRIGAKLLFSLYGGGSSLIAWASGFRPYAIYTVGSDVLLANGMRRLISRFVFRRAALIVANGKYLADRTRAISPGARVQAHYIGVDTSRFAFVGHRNLSVTRVVSSRGFIPVYNNEAILRALALMGAVAEGVGVTFVSSGPQLPQARELADRVLPPEIRRNVAFMGGADAQTLAGVMRGSDIYVSMSRSDGTSTSLLEAFASGAFPVLSDIPANREWFDETIPNMLIVPLDDDDALARALVRVVEDRALRERGAAHNRALVEQHADFRRTMPQLLRLLSEASGA
jgi:glycosyltransferase involved in cell wall biosynthesis